MEKAKMKKRDQKYLKQQWSSMTKSFQLVTSVGNYSHLKEKSLDILEKCKWQKISSMQVLLLEISTGDSLHSIQQEKTGRDYIKLVDEKSQDHMFTQLVAVL